MNVRQGRPATPSFIISTVPDSSPVFFRQDPFIASLNLRTRRHTFIISILAFRFCVTSAARFQLSTPEPPSPLPAPPAAAGRCAYGPLPLRLAGGAVAVLSTLVFGMRRDGGRGSGKRAGEFCAFPACGRGRPPVAEKDC